MKYTVGKYNIYPPKPFKTNGEAVSFINKRHPELTEGEILKHLKPIINEPNKLDNSIKEGSESKKRSSNIEKQGD